MVLAQPDGAVRSQGVQHGVLVLELDRDALLPTVRRLKDDFGFDMLLDVTAVDWPDAPLRFQVVHHLYSTTHHVRVRCVTRVSEAEARGVAASIDSSLACLIAGVLPFAGAAPAGGAR